LLLTPRGSRRPSLDARLGSGAADFPSTRMSWKSAGSGRCFGAGAVVTAQDALPVVQRLQTFAAALDHGGG
jgi:hypothetical protein